MVFRTTMSAGRLRSTGSRIQSLAPLAAVLALVAIAGPAEALPLTPGQTFVVEDFENPPGEQTQGIAACPPRSQVTGGGVYGGTLEDPDDARFGTFEQSINSSYPILGVGATGQQAGWYGIMNNAGTHLNRMLVFAICQGAR
jgi:hypothetical protein